IIATSIPLSVVATLLVMYRADISLNLMSLGGLTLGVGMIVDNSIVVLESIYRRRKEGLDLRRAAVEGTSEVGAAVIASTLTTVAVFIPMVFVEGIAGQLFGDQAMTVTISMLASVIVAMTVIPMLSAAGRSASRAQLAAGVAPPAERAMTLGILSKGYDVCLRAAVRRPWITMGTAAILFGVAVAALQGIGTALIPPLGKGEFSFEVRLPEGVSLAATDRVVRGMEESAARQPLVDRVYSTVGSRLVAGGMSLNTRAENLGQLNVVMVDGAGEAAEAEVIGTLRREFAGVPDLEVKFGRPSYFSLRTPIEVILFGEDIEDLRIASVLLAQSLESVPGLADLRSSLEAGNPELQVVFDRRRLASMGLEMRTLSDTLQTRIQGTVPTRFNEHDRQIDIRIRNLEKTRSSVGDVPALMVPGATGNSIRLVTVANVKEARGPAEIHRLQQQRAAVITANVTGRSLSAAIRDVEEVIAGSPGLRGNAVELGGQNREMQQSFASLRFALTLAIFLVYLVMAATFESFLHPLIVLFTIPLSLIGVVAGLLATGTDISIMVLIGCIVLAGIVVNNAIVLIDTANRQRGQGLGKVEAVVRAGHIRMRPILMTSSTTILGVIPMAIKLGEGSELSAPLAITVASGLAVSTLLTLLVIPAAYALVPARSGLYGPGGEAAGGETNPGAPS
ncbi:MAG TPA: efflux RND transporter permease subunit, partial [Planctomycetota bacterium]|nr:efflux RND transporter permease subunit [Planctomycetota bacterium]